jgi:hypothetical protein
MTGSWGFACVDGPLVGEVLMLDKPTAVDSLFRVSGLQPATHVYRFAGNRFVYVGPGPDQDAPDPA